jgi:hypothetical protein
MALDELLKLAEWKIVKTGKLKHNLYNVDFTRVHREISLADEKEKNDLLKDVCCLAIEAGTDFVCYLEHGEEYWRDEDGWAEGADNKWAEENLVDIKEVK